jgi:hypothetical protein
MSIYKELSPLINYIDSIRRLENYIVFDIKFPTSWKVLKKYIVEDKFVNNGIFDEQLFLSFVSDFNEDEISTTQKNILGIINYNLEREAKERLLESKINELKTIFDKESLDNLKVLKFNINGEKTTKLENVKNNETTKGTGLSEIIADEGQD